MMCHTSATYATVAVSVIITLADRSHRHTDHVATVVIIGKTSLRLCLPYTSSSTGCA
jgi:hypothetical protein